MSLFAFAQKLFTCGERISPVRSWLVASDIPRLCGILNACWGKRLLASFVERSRVKGIVLIGNIDDKTIFSNVLFDRFDVSGNRVGKAFAQHTR